MFDNKQRAYSEWLVIRCQRGDAQAFSALVKLWEARLLMYAMRRLNDSEAAKDATQECLLSVSKSLGRLADPAAFPKWLYQILERRCIDSIRRKVRDREFISDSDQVPELGKDDNTENEMSVAEVLRRFDPKIQSVLRLHYIDGLTVNEISEVLGVPAGTVKSRLFYARKTLSERTTTGSEEN